MNRLSRVVLFSALILSGYSSTCFASYFFFLKENGTPPYIKCSNQFRQFGWGHVYSPCKCASTGSPP